MNEPKFDTASAPGLATPDERTWGMIAHLSAFAGLVLPLGSLIGPLVVWLIRRDSSAFVADQGKEALNFNISVALAGIACLVLSLLFIGILLGVALLVYWLAMTIFAGIKAGEGIRYRHAFTLRLIK